MTKKNKADPLRAFLKNYPDTERIDLLFVDMNGVLRGKWLPVDSAPKIFNGSVRLPVSTSALDMWGHDVEGSGLGIVSGDKDGVGRPVASTLAPVPWAARQTAQILMTLDGVDGGPSAFDPRHRLSELLSRFHDLDLTPVLATELEFFLIRQRDSVGQAPEPVEGAEGSHLYDLSQMDAFETVLRDIQDACAMQGLPADAVIAESGVGQYEINFQHQADALTAADTAVLFRRLVRGVAQKHGYDATFMAKPYGADAGSGMHVHTSILGSDGMNIFEGDGEASQTLRHAIGGLLASMAELQLVFAPNANSYRRFSREGFAPTQANWGYDHRAAAVRVPEASGPASRFEHRLSGADVNPYLAIAAILGGALKGIEDKIDPGASMDDDLGSSFGDLGWDWQTAVYRFQRSDLAVDIFGADFARVYGLVKQDEISQLNRMVSDVEFRTYLTRF